MSCRRSISAIVVALAGLALVPASALAGGPPPVTLTVDTTSSNDGVCGPALVRTAASRRRSPQTTTTTTRRRSTRSVQRPGRWAPHQISPAPARSTRPRTRWLSMGWSAPARMSSRSTASCLRPPSRPGSRSRPGSDQQHYSRPRDQPLSRTRDPGRRLERQHDRSELGRHRRRWHSRPRQQQRHRAQRGRCEQHGREQRLGSGQRHLRQHELGRTRTIQRGDHGQQDLEQPDRHRQVRDRRPRERTRRLHRRRGGFHRRPRDRASRHLEHDREQRELRHWDRGRLRQHRRPQPRLRQRWPRDRHPAAGRRRRQRRGRCRRGPAARLPELPGDRHRRGRRVHDDHRHARHAARVRRFHLRDDLLQELELRLERPWRGPGLPRPDRGDRGGGRP